MLHNYTLPASSIEHLPQLVEFSLVLNHTLAGEISYVQQTGNFTEFKENIAVLRRDLLNHIAHFERWHDEAETEEEFQNLEKLAKYLAEGKELMTKAQGLLQKA